MRTYTVSGLGEGAATSVRQALKRHYGRDVTVVVDAPAGEVRIDDAADPQIVTFLIEGAGCNVVAVGSQQGFPWPTRAEGPRTPRACRPLPDRAGQLE